MGVDLGSSTTTVSTRRCDLRAESGVAERSTARFAAAPTDDDEPSPPALPAAADEPVLVVLAVPATWSTTRRRAHAEAAANAGFEASFLVSEPEAAARQFAEVRGRESDSDAPLVVCNLGAGSCHIGVVRREGDHYTVVAAKSADDIGGREFDRLLLEHLAGRHRHADPEFWARAGDPAETVLRAGLLDKVRRAREYLSDHPSVTVSLPGLGRDLRLTREDVDQCLTPAILRTVGLVEETMRDAAVEPDAIAGLLLVGGVSRTPLVASVFGHHLGIDPVRPDLPDLVIAEGAALAGLARIRSDRGEPPVAPGFARLRASPDVLVTAMVVAIAVVSFAGVAMLNRGSSDDEALDADSVVPSDPDSVSETVSAGAEPDPSEEPTSDDASASASPEPEGDDTGGESGSPTPSTSGEAATSATPYAPPASEVADDSAEVPDVVGESIADARRILAEAGFTNIVAQGDRRDSEGPKYDNCEVTAQTPDGGEQGEYDDEISVQYVFVGNDAC